MTRDFFRKKGIKVPAILVISPIEVRDCSASIWNCHRREICGGQIKGIPEVLPGDRRAEWVLVYGSVGVCGSL